MKKTAIVCLGVLAVVLMACDTETVKATTEQKDQAAVQEQQSQYQAAQPIPKLDWSLERDIVIQLYQARNERVATHTVWRGDTSVVEGDCPSSGYPLPYDTSLTNPLQPQWYHPHYQAAAGVSIEQPEPNGIFASKNSIATWVRCVVNDNEVPVYVEGKVTAYPYPVVVDYETGRVLPVVNAKPSVVIQAKGGG